ncbi:U11/U12 small nuclear ribonucleoprotein 48 kDa protein [Melipona quadrifasciata]|uniref:U11/U12 small nuclear ribonucleoprotein 48 kDa protein n=1 Tax=Melipona quadrifasciata TaxID=166423 RepID=A0A0M8ZRR5_9HYME|nr:U11/U12 small nuclear ribonucleoprotein 48 kDa protein [Melipona quadrifasciata]
MLNSTMNEREIQCQNLDDFTKKIHQEIVEITSSLNWTMESIKADNDNMLVCPYDSSHQISKKMLYRHLEYCQWKQEGYNEFDISLPESNLPLNSYSSIKLNSKMLNSILQQEKEKHPTLKIANYECPTWHKLYISFFMFFATYLNNIKFLISPYFIYFLSKHEFLTLMIGSDERLIPRTSNRIFTDFTCDERKVLYDYVTANTVKHDIGYDITDIQKLRSQDKEHKKVSFLELLIQERNLKRRRAKHKSVHTNKKSHIEVLREVIQQQMELYSDYVTETHTTNRDEKTITEAQNSNNNPDNVVNEFPSEYGDDLIEDPQDSRGNCSSQYKKYEHYEKSYATYPRDSKQRESSRSTTESWKVQETNIKHKHKRKRSYSKERDHDRKSKHGSTRKHKKSRKNEKSFDDNTCSKRSSDRRGSHEKPIL